MKVLHVGVTAPTYSSEAMVKAFNDVFGECVYFDWQAHRFNYGVEAMRKNLLLEAKTYNPDIIFLHLNHNNEVLTVDNVKELSEICFVIWYTEDVREDITWFEMITPVIGLSIFTNIDDVEKLKSITFKKGVLTDIIVEEATETQQKSIKQLMKRQRGKVQDDIKKTITLLFNPILQMHWIYKEYFQKIGWAETQTEFHNDRLSILKTTYKDNRFLEQDDIDDLENETDEYFYNVYTLGNWGVLGDVIFRNWKVADLNDPNDPYYLPEAQRTNVRRGGDFGFAGHPAAFGVSHYDKMRKRIYCYKELYETGLTNDVLAQRVKDMDEATGRSVWDSAEPKSIQELCNHGVSAVGARKGGDSIRHGINWLLQQEIIIDKTCINWINEIQQAHWKKDAGGNVISPPKPVDKNNHLLDGGLRYAYEEEMIEATAEYSDDPFEDYR